MSEDLNNLIQHALNQDYNKANQVFGDLMGQKLSDALEQEKIGIAGQVFNQVEPEEDYVEDDQEDDSEVEDDEELDFSDEEIEAAALEDDDEEE